MDGLLWRLFGIYTYYLLHYNSQSSMTFIKLLGIKKRVSEEIIKYLIFPKHATFKDRVGRNALHWVATYATGGIHYFKII